MCVRLVIVMCSQFLVFLAVLQYIVLGISTIRHTANVCRTAVNIAMLKHDM